MFELMFSSSTYNPLLFKLCVMFECVAGMSRPYELVNELSITLCTRKKSISVHYFSKVDASFKRHYTFKLSNIITYKHIETNDFFIV